MYRQNSFRGEEITDKIMEHVKIIGAQGVGNAREVLSGTQLQKAKKPNAFKL